MDGNADGEDGSCLGSKGSRRQSSPGCLVVPELILTSVISKLRYFCSRKCCCWLCFKSVAPASGFPLAVEVPAPPNPARPLDTLDCVFRSRGWGTHAGLQLKGCALIQLLVRKSKSVRLTPSLLSQIVSSRTFGCTESGLGLWSVSLGLNPFLP